MRALPPTRARLLRILALALMLATQPAASALDIDYRKTAEKYATPSATSASDPAVDAAAVAHDQANYAEYVRWQRAYARRGWEWHLMSTQALFGIVLGIVGFGLWITYQQFKRDYTGRRTRRPKAASAAGTEAPGPAPAPEPVLLGSTLKIGPAGLELTSQIVGLLVLAMSLAFFYFYVKEVYPMREIVREAGVAPPPAAASE